MSLRYRNNNGEESHIAGMNGTSGELVPSVSLYQSGTIEIPGQTSHSSQTLSVTFATPMPDANYQVTFKNRYGPGDILNVEWQSTTGFSVFVYNASEDSTGSHGLNWSAFKLMTDTTTAIATEQIAQNTRNFAPTFSESVAYSVGDYVTHLGLVFRCTTAHPAGAWDASHFTATTLAPTNTVALNNMSPVTSNAVTRMSSIALGNWSSLQPDGTDMLTFADTFVTTRVSDFRFVCHSATRTPGDIITGTVGSYNVDYFCTIYKCDLNNFYRIIAYDLRSNTMFINAKCNDVWQGWRQMADETLRWGTVTDVIGNGAGGYFSIAKRGEVADFVARLNLEEEISITQNQIVARIPTGFRPKVLHPIPVWNWGSTKNSFNLATINTDGNVTIVLPMTVDRLDIYITCSWLIDPIA